MMPGTVNSNRRVLVFVSVMVATMLGLLLLPPITQNQNYHEFADQRTILGIPHFWNVISNLPFIAVGAAGSWPCRRDPAIAALFLGILMTGFGSGYYHFDSNDRTLFWYRLPMAVGFMSILAIAIEARLGAMEGAIPLLPLIFVGVISFLFWRASGDLRLYGWVQFFPCVAVPVLFVFYSPKFSGTSYWLVAAALYALAKLFEFYDGAIYSFGSILSGHTFKHLAAAAACFAILRYFQTRQPIGLETLPRETMAKST